MEEARPRVGGLEAEDAVELGGVADGLVQLKRDLLRVDHDVHDAGRTFRRLEQSRGLLAHARRLGREPESDYELPPGLRAQPAERARIAALLREPVADRGGVDAGAALDQLLLDIGAF